MFSSKMALLGLIVLFAAATGSSQDPQNGTATQQKETASPQSSAETSSQLDSSQSKPKMIRVGGKVAAANLIHQVTPAYPLQARDQHIQGTVLLHTIIAKDGTIRELEYVSGPPELKDSAMKAVKKWRYKPFLLDGRPIEVDTKISVVFQLGGG